MIKAAYVYKGRFDQFKARYFPAWLKRLWPVRYLQPYARTLSKAIDRYEVIDNKDGTYTHCFTMKQ